MASRSSYLAYQLVLAALLVSLIAIVPAMAAITLTGVKYMADVAPGATVTFPMTLSSTASDSAADYDFTILGFGNGADGGYLGIETAQDNGDYTARPFITLDKTSVHIEPGGKEVVTATIQIPSNGEGGRYALVNIRPKQVSGEGVSFTTAMNVPVMITLKGTQLRETGAIESVYAGDAVPGIPVGIITVFTNTGNHHYYGAKNEIAVTDSSGKEVARISTAPSVTAIVPGGKVNFTQQIAATLGPGSYTVTSSMFDNKGTVLDTKTTSFTVGEPSTPAPTQTVSEAPTLVATEVPTQAVSEAPMVPTTVVTPGESLVTPETIATRAPLSVTTVMLALAGVSCILLMRRRN